jgi:hypothetical protein
MHSRSTVPVSISVPVSATLKVIVSVFLVTSIVCIPAIPASVCFTLSASVYISLVVSVSLTTPFLVSTAFASTIVVVPTCAASHVLEILHLDVPRVMKTCAVQRLVGWYECTVTRTKTDSFQPNARSSRGSCRKCLESILPPPEEGTHSGCHPISSRCRRPLSSFCLCFCLCRRLS